MVYAISRTVFILSCVFFTCFVEAQDLPRHLVDVRVLQQNTLPQNTSYRHHHRVVRWQGFNGATQYECHTDCSGLIDSLLEHSNGINPRALQAWLGGRTRPLAKNYYRAIVGQLGFQRIFLISAMQPGDFIAMEYLPWAGDKGNDTGHILVVDGPPRQIGQVNAMGMVLTKWAVDVIDCSTRGHGEQDTRYRDGSYHHGIGRGPLGLFTNAQGVVFGYSWSPSPNSEFYGPDRRPLAVGRLFRR